MHRQNLTSLTAYQRSEHTNSRRMALTHPSTHPARLATAATIIAGQAAGVGSLRPFQHRPGVGQVLQLQLFI